VHVFTRCNELALSAAILRRSSTITPKNGLKKDEVALKTEDNDQYNYSKAYVDEDES
jgi:hypothetical protein